MYICTMVSHHILYLLAYHDCVIIPGFGGLLSNHKSAEISLPEFTIYPPGKNIAFNRMLQTNDGLLTQQLAFSENITYKEAEKKLKSFVKDIDKQLQKSGTYSIEGIGRWYMDESVQLQFSPLNDGTNGASYLGFPVLSLKPVARLKGNISSTPQHTAKEVSAAYTVKALEELVNTTHQEDSEVIHESTPRYGWAYWSAAAAALLFVLGSFWINNATKNQLSPMAKGSLYFQTSTTKNTTKANTPTKNTAVKPASTAPKPVEFKKEEPEEDKSNASETKPTQTNTTSNPIVSPAPKPVVVTTTVVKPTTPAPATTTAAPAKTPTKATTPTPVKSKTGKLYIVAGSFGSEKNAQFLQNELSQKGYSGKIIKNPENGMFRVVMETNAANREADLKKAKQDIAPSVWVLED